MSRQEQEMYLWCVKNVAHDIARVLASGDRVEIIPSKDGIKVVDISRKEIKFN